MKNINIDQVRQDLYYDSDTGDFFWNTPKQGRSLTTPAGTLSPDGYVIITYEGEKLLAHRLAFFYMTGEWPLDHIRHKDDNSANNAWDNLVQTSYQATARRAKEKFDPFKAKPPTTNNIGNRNVRAKFSKKAVLEAVDDFIKDRQLIDGVYIEN